MLILLGELLRVWDDYCELCKLLLFTSIEILEILSFKDCLSESLKQNGTGRSTIAPITPIIKIDSISY